MKFLLRKRMSKRLSWTPLLDAMENRVDGWMRKLGTYLNGKTTGMSKWETLGFLGCVIVLFLSGFWLTTTGRSGGGSGKSDINKVSVPAHVASPRFNRLSNEDFTDSEIAHLRIVVAYTDSLHSIGSPLYDSILRRNPGIEADLSRLKVILEKYKN